MFEQMNACKLLISVVREVYTDGGYIHKPSGFWLGNLALSIEFLLGHILFFVKTA